MISAKQARYIVAESVGECNKQIAAQEWLKNRIEPLIVQAWVMPLIILEKKILMVN